MIPKSTQVTVLLVATLAAACGSDKSTSPTAPSSAVASSASPAPVPPASGVVSGATISGTVVGGSGSASTIRTLSAGGLAVTATGTGTSSSSPVDAAGHFTLQGVPPGHVDLHFAGGGHDAHLGLDEVAEHEDINLTVVVNGSTAELEHDERADGSKIEVEGRVAQINAAARTLRIGTTDITAPAGIPIRHGNTAMALSDIHAGDRLHVRGTGTRTAVTASIIEVQTNSPAEPGPPTPGAGGDHAEGVELSGTVASRSGSCPALTFRVGSTVVATVAATAYENVTCAALANGDKVDVKGSKSSTGTVSATKVSKKK